MNVKKKYFGYSLIIIGLAGIINIKLLAGTCIVIGLINIDQVYEQVINWLKRTFRPNKNYDEDWIEISEEGGKKKR